MNQLSNEDIRRVLEFWCESGQIERHRFPIITENMKAAGLWLLFVICACIMGFLLGYQIGGK